MIGGGWLLAARKRPALAAVLLSVLAVPGVLYALFVLMIVVTQPRWN